jgi:Ca-activated chloride channel family protein
LALVMPPASETLALETARASFVLDNLGPGRGIDLPGEGKSLLACARPADPAEGFNVIRFDDTLTVLFPTPVTTPENVAYAKGHVAHLEAQGGTEMPPALRAALADATLEDRAHLRQIFLTDGAVGNEAQLSRQSAPTPDARGCSRWALARRQTVIYERRGARSRGTTIYRFGRSVAPRMAELFAARTPGDGAFQARPETMHGEFWPNPLPDLMRASL